MPQPITPMLWNLKVPTATTLQSGKVLIVEKDRAEIYDAALDTWSAAAPPLVARTYPTATLLPDGKVLLAGGYGPPGAGPIADAELYDPATNTWTATAPMSVIRVNHTATLLPNGKVFIVGGFGYNGLYSTELYDPVTQTWAFGPAMGMFHFEHTATLFANGNLLVAGSGGQQTSSTVELFDAATSTWSFVGSMHTRRKDHTATLLPDGSVLVAGGYDPDGSQMSFSSAELYAPATKSWTWTGAMSGDRKAHTATLLPSGKVLVTGGEHVSTVPFHSFDVKLSTTELFDPTTGTWASGPSMQTERTWATATLLANGRVLIAEAARVRTPSSSPRLALRALTPRSARAAFAPTVSVATRPAPRARATLAPWQRGRRPTAPVRRSPALSATTGAVVLKTMSVRPEPASGPPWPTALIAKAPASLWGTCAAGSCVGAAAPDGTSCNDGNACTSGDVCQSGACAPGAGVTCSAADTCHDAGSCDPSTGLCSSPSKHNGSSCPAGVCQIGACVGGVTWTPTGGVDAPPRESTATLLLDGRVLSFGDSTTRLSGAAFPPQRSTIPRPTPGLRLGRCPRRAVITPRSGSPMARSSSWVEAGRAVRACRRLPP